MECASVSISSITDIACLGTSAPTIEPTAAPTNSFDYYIDVVYDIQHLTQRNAIQLTNNTYKITSDITNIIESV